MARFNLRGAIPLFLTALFIVLAAYPGLVPSRPVLFLLFFLYTVITPGALLARRFAPALSGATLVLASFVFGMAAAFAILFLLALLRLDVTLVRFIAPAVVVALAVWPRRGAIDRTGETAARPASRDAVPAILLVVLLAIVAAIVLGRGDPLLYTADSADHIAYIRTIARTHEAFPERFYYAESGMLTRDIRKGMAHALWGTLAALAGTRDAAAIWPIVSLIGSAFLLVAVYAAGIALFGSAWIGLLAAALTVLLYDGGLTQLSLVVMGGGYSFGKAAYVAFLAFGIPWALKGGRSLLWPAAAAGAVAAQTHIAHFAFILFMLTVMAFSTGVRRTAPDRRAPTLRRIAALAGSVCAIVAPYLVMRYVRDYAPNNDLHTQVQGVLYFTERLYVMNPLIFGQVSGWLGLLSLVAVVFLWRRTRDHDSFRFFAHGLIAVYVMLFVPLWYPFLLRAFSYLLIRFEFAVPSMLMTSFLIGELIRGMRRRGGIEPARADGPIPPRGVTIVGIVVAAVVLGVALGGVPERCVYTKRAAAAMRPASFHAIDDLFAAINEQVPPGSVIAADPFTSFGIPAFTDQYVIVPYEQHATPNDSTAIRRMVDTRRIMSPWTSWPEIAAILTSYRVDCVAVNGRIPPTIEAAYWKPSSAAAASLVAKLSRAENFRAIFENESVALFALDAERSRLTEWVRAPFPFAGDAVDPDSAAAMADARVPGVRIASVELAPSRAARGDTIEAVVTWVGEKPLPFSSYVAYLRFDTPSPRGRLYNAAWGKPYRKIRERLAGERYRFRFDFHPFGGLLPPDEWPSLRKVRDRILVPIPRDVAAGAYVVSLRMARKTQYPNYVLRDILTDDDSLGGAAVARIDIE